MVKKNISPTVLLVDELGNDCCLTRAWLETNGYRVRNATSIGDALDEATDFTQSQRPAMILLNTALSVDDCKFVMESFHEFAELQNIPIVALAGREGETGDGDDEYFVPFENLDTLKPLMSSLLPLSALKMRAATAHA